MRMPLAGNFVGTEFIRNSLNNVPPTDIYTRYPRVHVTLHLAGVAVPAGVAVLVGDGEAVLRPLAGLGGRVLVQAPAAGPQPPLLAAEALYAGPGLCTLLSCRPRAEQPGEAQYYPHS